MTHFQKDSTKGPKFYRKTMNLAKRVPMFVNVSKFLVLIFSGLLATAWASKVVISFDSNLHYCVNEETKVGPVYLKKGSVGPCHDFSDEKLGAFFRFKLLFADNLSGSSFQGIKVKKLNLSEKKLEGVNFIKAQVDLFLANNSIISFSDFSEAVLSSANFKDAMALSARFRGSNLHGADLSGGHFDHAFFEAAVLTSANLHSIECRQCVLKGIKGQQIQAENTRFEGADFGNAELKFGKFKNANFEGANLQGSDFSSAELDGAQFKGADLTGAIFHTASLLGADLSEVKGEDIKWRFAKFDSATKLPFSSDEAVQQFGMIFIP